MEVNGKAKNLINPNETDICIKFIQIEVQSEEEKKKVAEEIHNQLKGNQDYIDSNILLNIDEPYMVKIWFFDKCKEIPKLLI